MTKTWRQKLENNSSPFIKVIRIILLILIIIGIGLIATQNIWAPKLTDYFYIHQF